MGGPHPERHGEPPAMEQHRPGGGLGQLHSALQRFWHPHPQGQRGSELHGFHRPHRGGGQLHLLLEAVEWRDRGGQPEGHRGGQRGAENLVANLAGSEQRPSSGHQRAGDLHRLRKLGLHRDRRIAQPLRELRRR